MKGLWGGGAGAVFQQVGRPRGGAWRLGTGRKVSEAAAGTDPAGVPGPSSLSWSEGVGDRREPGRDTHCSLWAAPRKSISSSPTFWRCPHPRAVQLGFPAGGDPSPIECLCSFWSLPLEHATLAQALLSGGLAYEPSWGSGKWLRWHW